MAPSTTVRDLRLTDLADVAWAGSPTHLRHVRHEIARAEAGEVDYLAVCHDGRILGIGAVDYAKHPGAGYLWQLSVHPDHQSQGLGTALIAALERRAATHGATTTCLSVETDNPRARQLYERLGYVAVGTSTDSWDEELPDGSVRRHDARCTDMRKDLSA